VSFVSDFYTRIVVRAELRPTGPYSLRLSGRLASDACRVVVDGTFRSTIRVEGRLEQVQAAQRPDGTIVVVATSEAGVDHVRFVLGLDDDHTEFLQRFADDPLLAETLRRMRGLRPMRTGTVAQALLRAVAGQLILAKRARQIERSIIRAASPELGGMHAAPSCAELGAFSPAQLARHGLGARRAAALIRLCRGRELESLKSLPVAAVAARLNRERGLGPWSVGVICLEGLGRYEFGLARDLGLVKLTSALWGRWVEAEETDELLAPYGSWAGLASVYLLAGYHRGLIPLPDARLIA
jgi:3-methyladenine DNA glycosylase/8-oxoguanine DNA glycosylase